LEKSTSEFERIGIFWLAVVIGDLECTIKTNS